MRNAIKSSSIILILLNLSGCLQARDIGLQPSDSDSDTLISYPLSSGGPIQVDFLWVIDSTPSMSRQQATLATHFAAFKTQLNEAFELDPHIAVTNHNANCRLTETDVSMGRFSNTTESTYVSNNIRIPAICRNTAGFGGIDEGCEDIARCPAEITECALTGGWNCTGHGAERTAEAPLNSCLLNDGSEQTLYPSCSYTCQEDSDCIRSDGKFRCINNNCTLIVPTKDCPTQLPRVLTSETIDYFPCLANQKIQSGLECFDYHAGMASAYMALSSEARFQFNGSPINLTFNSEQRSEFLRDDAYLVLIFITNDDDCSSYYEIGPDSDVFGKTYVPTNTCNIAATLDEEGAMYPVSRFVNHFRSLKNDPFKVIVTAIAGDANEDSEELNIARREAYLNAKTSPGCSDFTTSICHNSNGAAEYALRYQKLIEMFGIYGQFANICTDDDFSDALAAIADRIVSVVNRFCLPEPIINDNMHVYKKLSDGSEIEINRGDGDNDYRIIDDAAWCNDNEVIGHPAILLNRAARSGESIRVVYSANR